MASGGFEATLSELIKAAAAFGVRGDEVKQALARFRSAADVPGGAFGNLEVSGKMASGYEEFFSQVTTVVTKLSDTLEAGAESLFKSAVNYWAAEHLVQRYLRYVHEVKLDNAGLINGPNAGLGTAALGEGG